MTRKPNWTVVGGTIGHITGPLEVQVDDEDDALVENEEQDEQDED